MKDIIYGNKVRRILLKGVDKIYNAVKVTLGPKGKNVVLACDYTHPMIVNDGVTIAKEIELSNEMENVGVEIIREVAMKTNDLSGDGTTTSLILAREIFKNGIDMIKRGYNPVFINEKIDLTIDHLINKVKEESIKDRNYIKEIGTISSENEEIGILLNNILKIVNRPESIILEESNDEFINYEIIEGMKIDSGYVTNEVIKENEIFEVLNECNIFVTNETIFDMEELFESFNKNEFKNILIIAEDFDETAIEEIVKNDSFHIIPIKAISYGAKRKEILKDICVYTSSELIKLDDIKLESIGYAEKVKVEKDRTIIFNNVNKEKVQERINFINKELKEENSDYEKEIFYQRISNLNGKLGIIKVGGKTEVEKLDKKLRIEDALGSIKSALKLGVSLGGGKVYFNLADDLKNNDVGEYIIKKSLTKPLEIIITNSGYKYNNVIKEIMFDKNKGFDGNKNKIVNLLESGIVDSSDLVISVLKNSASIAKMLLTSEVLVVNKSNQKFSMKNINDEL